MIVIVSAKTGFPEAILRDNGHLTDVRIDAASAVAARHLACRSIETVRVIGSGAQARYQIRALKLVCNFRWLLVYGVFRENTEIYAEEMRSLLGVDVVRAKNAETVIGEGDALSVVVTPSREPYVRAEWLHPGLHITAMGADGEVKQELYPEGLQCADVLAGESKFQCFRLGELHHGLEASIISEDDPVIKPGEIASGRNPG